MDIFGALEFWRVDALLDGAVCLKLACLLEARAGDQSAVVGVWEAPLVRGLKGVERAHQMEYMEGVQEEVTVLSKYSLADGLSFRPPLYLCIPKKASRGS